MAALKKLERVLVYIKKAWIVVMVGLAGAIVCIIMAQVFMRYFFGRPFDWAEELATLMLIYLSFISADVVYKEKAHISVNYFVEKLPFHFQKIINIVIYLLIAIILINIIPGAYKLISRQTQIITTAAIRLAKSYYTLPVLIVFPSMVLSTIFYLAEEVIGLFNWYSKKNSKVSSATNT